MKRLLLIFVVTMTGVLSAQEIGAHYLIITHDDFYNAIQPLANWKHKKGLRTKITKLSQIGSTADMIRNYVVNAYNTWQIPPEYLLLVGAPNFLPFGVIGTSTDNYYTDINGDLFNDILSGRLTVHSTTEAQTVVNKILLYERTPDLTDPTWFIDACLVVNEDNDPYDDSIYWSDINHAKNYMRANGYDTIDTLSDFNGDDANDIIQAVNQGRAFVLYRGQGVNNWYSPFDVNADLTANGNKLPIVLSITCRTISTSSTPAVAEKWLLTGSPTSPRGGVGFFATTTTITGHADYRSAVAKGFFDGVFLDRKRTFGEACEVGRRRVYSMYSSSSEYRGFTTLGDPEMNIWTATPRPIIVDHPPVVTNGFDSICIHVSTAHNSAPVESALVCLMAETDTSIYQAKWSDASGNAYFTLSPLFLDDTIHVTVTGRNLLPYEHWMLTVAANRYVIYLKSEVNDSLGGNNDRTMNPNEEIRIPLWVKNYGDSTAQNVIGVLRTIDPYVTITDSIRTFGDVASGDSAFTGQDGYVILTSPNTPDNHTVGFNLACSDINDSTWASHFSESIHTAILQLDGVNVGDENGNGSFEAAESASVALTLSNTGSVSLENVTLRLQSLSPYITVVDSIGTLLHIGAGSIATNNADPFVVRADSATPYGTLAMCRATVNAGYYIDTLDITFRIGVFVPTDTGYYFAYRSDGNYPHSPIFEWIAIDSTQTVYQGVSLDPDRDQTIAVGLPFSFTYYGNAYDSISICSNGWIALGNEASVDNSNSTIPNPDGPAAMIAGLWDAMEPNNAGQPGDIYYYYDAAQHRFIVEYFRVEHSPGGSHETFEIMLLDPAYYPTPTADGEIIVQYLTAMHQFDNTIGIESANEMVGVQYFFNEVYDSLAGVVTDSFALKYTTFPPHDLGIDEFSEPTILPSRTEMTALHPVPFRQRLTINFDLSTRSRVLLRIYDAAGRAVRTLVQGIIEPGCYSELWNACDDSDRRLPAGVYFVKLHAAHIGSTETLQQVEKTVLLR